MFKKTTAVVVVMALMVVSLHAMSFSEYVKKYQKPYTPNTPEYRRHELTFLSNVKKIAQHNAQGQSWKMGINQFTDMDKQDMKSMKGYSKSARFSTKRADSPRVSTLSVSELPESVDWRFATTPVKNQGRCGSCWAFATIETVESALYMATGTTVELSEQQLVSCMANPDECGGTGGCEGAIAELGFQFIADNGIAEEWTYPYTSGKGDSGECYPEEDTKPMVEVEGYVQLAANNYEALMNAIATEGPIAVSVDASVWHLYDSGVFDGCDIEDPDLDHAVQLVGYGVDDVTGLPYWLVRNSWSPLWGENGYIRLRRRTEGQLCGVDTHPLDGDGCEGGPANVTVCGTCGILYDSAYPVGVSYITG